MSGFKTQNWMNGGAIDVIIAPDENTPADKRAIRYVASTFGQGLDENMANARLIAAAPEMYRLLECLLDMQDACGLTALQVKAREVLKRIDGAEAENDG